MDNRKSVPISAVVCTYNRAAILSQTLQSLMSQSLDPSGYEIIVVDNGSTDETKTVVEDVSNRVPDIRYVCEPRLGVSRARNRGIREANGEIIAFIDDDEQAESDWLFEITRPFYDVKPAPSCVGGKTVLTWEMRKPEWLSDILISYLGSIDWGDVPHWILLPREYFGAGNMAFVKKDLEDQGGFSPSLGRIGNALLSNEEILLLYKLQGAGKGIYYQPNACVRHLVHKLRVNRRFFLRRAYWQGISDAIVNHCLGNSSESNCLGKLKWSLQTCVGKGFSALSTTDMRQKTRYLVQSAYNLGAAVQEARIILNRQMSATASRH